MKEIEVVLRATYGSVIDGNTDIGEETEDIEVEDSVFELLQEMQNKGIGLNQKDIKRCIAGCKKIELTPEQKALLSSLHEQISKMHRHMTNMYWVYEAYNEFERESLMEAMQQDIKTGLYKPYLSFEEFKKRSRKKYEDEEDARDIYDDLIYNDYRHWVYDRDKISEIEFIADRIGVNLDGDVTPLEYVISLSNS